MFGRRCWWTVRSFAHPSATVTLVFATLLGFAVADEAHAQRPTTRGVVLGLDVGTAVVALENTPTDQAGVVGGRFGYGFNRLLTVYVAAYEVDVDIRDFDGFDKVTFGHLDLGLRLHLADHGRRWVPYGEVAITHWPVSDILKNGEPTTTNFTGGASSLGGGLAVYLVDGLAIDLNLKWSRGGFTHIPAGDLVTTETAEHAHTFLDRAARSTRFGWRLVVALSRRHSQRNTLADRPLHTTKTTTRAAMSPT